MKTTSSAGALLKSASATTFPLGSGSRKSGALVPSGSIVELTATMQRTWNGKDRLSNGKRRRMAAVQGLSALGWPRAKSETRRPKAERNPKSEARARRYLQPISRPSDQAILGFRVSAFFRVSGFDLRTSGLPALFSALVWLVPRMYLPCTSHAPPNLLPSTWLVPPTYLPRPERRTER